MSRFPAGVDFLVGLIAGAIVGAAFSVAVAPRPGRETREQLGGAGGSATSAVLSAPEALRAQIGGAVQSQVDRFHEAVAAAREAREQTEQELLQEYEQSIEQARQAN